MDVGFNRIMGLIRFILAISVYLSHVQRHFNVSLFGLQLVGGEVAVVSFFIISGFYISLILNEKYIDKNDSFFLYISNRFLRIYPLYWLILVLSFTYFITIRDKIFEYILIFPSTFINVLHLLQSIFQNLFLFTSISYFIHIPYMYTRFIVEPAWSLGVELIFYILAPFLVKGGIRKTFFILIFSLLLRIYVTHINIFYPVYSLPFLFLPNLYFFMLGAMSFQIFKKIKKPLNSKLYYSLTIVVLIYILLYNFIPILFFSTFKRHILYILIFICTPFLFIIDTKIKYFFFLGELSYPIYLSHFLTLLVINHISFLSLKNSWSVLAATFIVFFISYLLKKYVADPINIYRINRIKRK